MINTNWIVLFQALPEGLQDELLAQASRLGEFGRNLGRPTVYGLKGSQRSNIKEPRFNWASGVWRFAFSFAPKWQAILLAGGEKGGADQRRFYKRLITVADSRFEEHLAALVKAEGESKHGKKAH